MKEKELELVIDQPEEAIMISADGRRLWRIFDNLLNNICKYSQHGTRVYLSLVKKEGSAEISFKNTSREQLNITAEELKERFVRGDSSRNTEGNGLGLSIAQSLTELQHGTMELSVDGDLFKVTLCFPLRNQSV
jgi:signal transduction histidine kinase